MVTYKTFRNIAVPVAALASALVVWYAGSLVTGFPPPHRFLTESSRKEFRRFGVICETPYVRERVTKNSGTFTGYEPFDKLVCAERLFKSFKLADQDR